MTDEGTLGMQRASLIALREQLAQLLTLTDHVLSKDLETSRAQTYPTPLLRALREEIARTQVILQVTNLSVSRVYPGDFMKPEEAADYLRIRISTLRRFIKQGKIPAVAIGKTYRLRRSEIEAWMEKSS